MLEQGNHNLKMGGNQGNTGTYVTAIVSTNGTIRYASPVYQQYFCTSVSIDDGRENVFSHIHPDALTHIMGEWNHLLDDKQPVDIEWLFRGENGQAVVIQGLATPVSSADEGLDFIILVGQDVSAERHREEKLRNRERRYRNLVELSLQPIVVHKNGEIVYANPAAVQLVDAQSHHDLLGQSIFDMVQQDGRDDAVNRSMYAMTEEGNVIELAERVIHFNGKELIVEVTGVGIRYDGEPAVQLYIRDITARKAAENARLRAEAVLRGQNKILTLILKGASLHQTLQELVSQMEMHRPNITVHVRLALEETTFDIGLEVDPDQMAWSHPLSVPSGSVVGSMTVGCKQSMHKREHDFSAYDTYGQLADVAIHQKLSTEEITHLAYHDPLTNLPNRRVIQSTFEEAILDRMDGQLTVMILDIDRFKTINDTFGHETGDKVIQVIASRLVVCVGEGTVVARSGGDEFTILIHSHHQPTDALNLANRMLQAIRQTVYIENREFYITTSIGISSYPEHGRELGDLIKSADVAMYHAKSNGRNKVSVYDSKMDDTFQQQHRLETDLRKAIDRNEFTLNYQPKVAIQSNRITGVEALIRWAHPIQGEIMPQDFIRVAEETGMIIQVGEWVIEAVLKQLREWNTAGKRLVPIALNVSVQQFVQPTFAQFVETALRKYEVEPKYIELEITETALMTNVEVVANNVFELSRIGVNVVLDDFGTGYSSLSFLNKFAISCIKIDRSFVTGLLFRDSTCENILISIVSLGKGLGIKVIAEGVEFEEQLQFLKDRGCDEAQGYFFSKPVPIAALDTMLQEGLHR